MAGLRVLPSELQGRDELLLLREEVARSWDRIRSQTAEIDRLKRRTDQNGSFGSLAELQALLSKERTKLRAAHRENESLEEAAADAKRELQARSEEIQRQQTVIEAWTQAHVTSAREAKELEAAEEELKTKTAQVEQLTSQLDLQKRSHDQLIEEERQRYCELMISLQQKEKLDPPVSESDRLQEQVWRLEGELRASMAEKEALSKEMSGLMEQMAVKSPPGSPQPKADHKAFAIALEQATQFARTAASAEADAKIDALRAELQAARSAPSEASAGERERWAAELKQEQANWQAESARAAQAHAEALLAAAEAASAEAAEQAELLSNANDKLARATQEATAQEERGRATEQELLAELEAAREAHASELAIALASAEDEARQAMQKKERAVADEIIALKDAHARELELTVADRWRESQQNAYEEGRQFGREEAEARGLEQLSRMDTNKDGVIDMDEFLAAGGSRSEFEKFDTNNDGVLDQQEMIEREMNRPELLEQIAQLKASLAEQTERARQSSADFEAAKAGWEQEKQGWEMQKKTWAKERKVLIAQEKAAREGLLRKHHAESVAPQPAAPELAKAPEAIARPSAPVPQPPPTQTAVPRPTHPEPSAETTYQPAAERAGIDINAVLEQRAAAIAALNAPSRGRLNRAFVRKQFKEFARKTTTRGTFDDIAAANEEMDLAELSKLAREVGLVPFIFSNMAALRRCFAEVNTSAVADENLTSLCLEEFSALVELCLDKMQLKLADPTASVPEERKESLLAWMNNVSIAPKKPEPVNIDLSGVGLAQGVSTVSSSDMQPALSPVKAGLPERQPEQARPVGLETEHAVDNEPSPLAQSASVARASDATLAGPGADQDSPAAAEDSPVAADHTNAALAEIDAWKAKQAKKTGSGGQLDKDGQPAGEGGLDHLNRIPAIFMVGGQGTEGTAELFFPSDPGCVPIASTSVPRASSSAVLLDGLVYALGGWNGECLSSVERYEPGISSLHAQGADHWAKMASMAQRRSQFGAAVLDGQIYAVGGRDDGNNYLTSVERYSSKFDSWRPVSPILVGRCGMGCASVGDNLYVVGGFSGRCRATVEVYSAQSNQWLPVAPLNNRRAYLAVTECRGMVYAIGGFDGRYMSSVERYNSAEDAWEEVAPMAVERSSAAAVCCEDKIYVLGGWNGIACRTIECYDPELNTWSMVGQMDNDRVGLCCAVHTPSTHSDELSEL